MSQLLGSCCVTLTHAVQISASSSAFQSNQLSALSKAVVDALQSQLLHAPVLLSMCPSVFHPQHAHSEHVWSQLLHSMLSSAAALSSTSVLNTICISTVFKELRQTCKRIASAPGSTQEHITRDVVAKFVHEVCPASMSDLATNAAAFTSRMRGLSPPELDLNQEMMRLLCNVVAPILRAAPFPKAVPILNLCAFEYPIPALLIAQNSVCARSFSGAVPISWVLSLICTCRYTVIQFLALELCLPRWKAQATPMLLLTIKYMSCTSFGCVNRCQLTQFSSCMELQPRQQVDVWRFCMLVC